MLFQFYFVKMRLIKFVFVLVSLLLAIVSSQAQKHEIEWLTFEELEKRMAEQPRQVIIDLYTDWCSWCKVMDKKTFGHEEVAKYISDHYYAVRFNAESKQPVTFNGKTYQYKPEIGLHELAAELMMGKRSFPCIVFMEKNMMSVFPITGYFKVAEFEPIVRFFAERKPDEGFEEWNTTFQALWK